MICFQALGVRFCLPLLTLIMPLLAMHLGMHGNFAGILFALGMHELAHVLAAAATGVQITEIRLLPFGGSARMENPYGVPALRMLLVAAAGPAVNLLLAVVFAALAQWGLLSPASAAALVQCNLVLFGFNLLPALPLDGGRMLFCLLQRRLGEERAMLLGVWLGWLLAGLLLTAALAGGLMAGRWNLSFILAAVFIITSGRDERAALRRSRVQRLSALQADVHAPLPVRIYRVGAGVTLSDAIALLRPRECTWFVLKQDGCLPRIIEDRSIFRHIIANGAADLPLGDMPIEEAAAPLGRIRN